MQKFKYYASKYAVVSVIFLLLFIALWFFGCWHTVNIRSILNISQGDFFFNLTDKDLLTNLFTDNYQGFLFFSILLPLPFAFAINYLINDEKMMNIVRYKSRGGYIKEWIIHIITFAFIFAVLHEIVNILLVSCFYNWDLINELKILQYTLLNTLSIFIYFARVGAIFLFIRILTNKKIAPYLLFAVYFIEYYIPEFILKWRPLYDVSIIGELITQSKSPVDMIAIVVRGVCMTAIVFILAYFKFQNKDILSYEKR